MKILEGKSVFPGIAIGKIQVWMEEWDQVKRVHVPDRNQELRRLDEAKEKAIVELKELHQKAEIEAGSSEAEIFEVHQMMLDEGEYIESIRNRIRTESVNAEYAATAAGEYFADMFRKMDNEYIKERAADILDITRRLVRVLSGEKQNRNIIQEPVILAAQNLSPSDTILLDKSMILAFVLKKGSVNSHTAILARAMEVPAVLSIENICSIVKNGDKVVLDGTRGEAILNPDDETVEKFKKMYSDYQNEKALLKEYAGKPSQTKDGVKVELVCNIGKPADANKAVECDGEGIGLFRTEFLFMDRDSMPTEEEQFEAYKEVNRLSSEHLILVVTRMFHILDWNMKTTHSLVLELFVIAYREKIFMRFS